MENIKNIVYQIKYKLTKNSFYNKYKKKIYSQWGEEGIIIEIFRRLNIDINNKYVCEFGAWDGIKYSNTFLLVEKFNCKAVYIEGDTNKYKELLKTSHRYNNIIPVNKYVSTNSQMLNNLEKSNNHLNIDNSSNTLDKLDNILKNYNIPTNFLILSIDIDGYDYQVWESVVDFKPILVIIEIGSGIPPPHKRIYNKNGWKEGSSFQSMYELAKSKGYEFICHTGNMIFIDNKYYHKLNLERKHYLYNFCPRHVKSYKNKLLLIESYNKLVSNS